MQALELRTTGDSGTLVEATAVAAFGDALQGVLLRPGDGAYDETRTVWNGMVDRRPALIARCAGAADVLACVRFAREHDLLVSVRGGGHNYAGTSVCDGGLMIDLSPMKGITVDPERRTARAEPGLRLGEFDRATQAFGLATTLGIITDTGIAGLTLGGGYGWLAGRYGMACDNLIAADVVTADGRLVTADASRNADLFWGLRGAGANLGIVTSFEYRLHPVGPVLGGMVLYPMSRGAEVLRLFDEYSSSCPDDVTLAALCLTAPDGTPAVAVAACHCGPLDEGEEALKPLRTLATPLADLIAPRPYLEMQSMFDAAFPAGRLYYSKSSIIRRLTDDAIDAFLDRARVMPTPFSSIVFQQLHGAAARVRPDETAFPHRYDHHSFYLHPVAEDPAVVPKMVDWAREGWRAVQPFAERAIYVNGVEDPVDEGRPRVRDAYGPNYERLVELKNTYDPTNLFRLNANIPPHP
jgi:FAD/FMN-containing dehydrogenase